MVHSFKYLGVDIYPYLQDIVLKNYNNNLTKVTSDLANWTHLPTSLHARMSVIKMKIFSRINFYSFMIPFSPLIVYSKNFNSVISHYIWNGKQPRIKLSTLQRSKTDGGWSIPNFKFYADSFHLRALSSWFNPYVSTSRQKIEEAILFPHDL